MGAPGIIVHTKWTCLGQSSWVDLFSFLFFFKYSLILAVLGLCCSVRTSLDGVSGGYYLVALCRLLTVLAPLTVDHRLWGTRAAGVTACRLQSVGLIVVVHGLSCPKTRGGLPRPGMELVPLRCKADS